MSSVLGGGKSKSTSYTSQTDRVYLPEWIDQPIQDLIPAIEALINRPFTPYEGNRVAPLTGDEQRSFQLIRDMLGQTSTDLTNPMATTQEVSRRGLEGFSQDILDQYMNPYIENVMDISRGRQLDQFDLAKRELAQRQGNVAAFGGSRSGLAEAQLYDNFQRQLAENEALQLYQGYTDSQNRAMAGTQLAGQSAMDQYNQILGRQGASYRDISALQQAGGLQRGVDQAGLDANYQEFLREQAFPYENLQFGLGSLLPIGQLVRGSDSNSTTVSSTKGGGSGLLGSALGVASMAMGIPGVSSAVGMGLNSLGFGGFASSILGQNAFGRGYSPIDPRRGFGSYINWLNKGGRVSAIERYADGGTVSGKIKNFMNYLNGQQEPAVENVEQPSYTIIEDSELYPGGPTRSKFRDVWENIIDGNESGPSSQDYLEPVRQQRGLPDKEALTKPNTSLQKFWNSLEKKYSLPKGVLRAKRQVESSGGKNLLSDAGAEGPFQLMPITQKHLGISDPYDEYESAEGAAKLMREYLDMFDGNFDKAMAAYNWGPKNVKEKGMQNLPTETRRHLKKLKREMSKYADGGQITGFQRDLNKYLVNPLLTGYEGLQLKQADMARGMSGALDYFTQPVKSKSNVTRVLDALSEDAQLRLLENKLDRNQLPINLNKMMNQVGPLVDKGATDVRLNRHGTGLDVYDFVDNPVSRNNYTQSPTQNTGRNIKDVVNTILEQSKKKSGSGAEVSDKPMETRFDKEINYPLLAFGSALLQSNDDFFTALGQAGSAALKTDVAIKQTKQEAIEKMAKRALEERRLAAYERQIDVSSLKSPYDLEKRKLELEKLRKDVDSNPKLQKRVDDLAKTLLENYQANSAQEAYSMAEEIIMGESGGGDVSSIVDAYDYFK